MKMNDRYLSKAKRIDNGEWIIGFYVQINEIDFICTRQLIHGGLYTVSKSFKVDKTTICQCTGLTDKNGQEIWENDIVRVWGDTDDFGNDLYYFFKVVWNKDLCCWWLSDIYTKDDECLYIYLKEIEILGNVFDNQELLEGGE